MTVPRSEDIRVNSMNMSMLPDLLNGTIFDGDHITEKIRSYYPSCNLFAVKSSHLLNFVLFR
jgi:hypothetical protein